MEQALNFILGLLGDLLGLLNSVSFSAFGVEVSYLVVIGSFIVVTMVVNVFWRGVKG